MKKTFLLLTILSLSFGVCAQQSTKKTTIVGQIEGLDNDTLIIFSSSLLSSIEDTSGSKQDIIITQGNRFEYEVSDNTMIHIETFA